MRKTIKYARTPLSESDWETIRKALKFIETMSDLTNKSGLRLVVFSGYAVDANLGEITRPHRDVDILIYGEKDEQTTQMVRKLLSKAKVILKLPGAKLIDKGRQEYYYQYVVNGDGLGADVYCMQTTSNPFAKHRFVIKNDGSLTEKQEYKTKEVKLEGVSFESLSADEELANRIEFRSKGKTKIGLDQDIKNLTKLLK